MPDSHVPEPLQQSLDALDNAYLNALIACLERRTAAERLDIGGLVADLRELDRKHTALNGLARELHGKAAN